MELGKAVKYGHKLNDKVLNPLALEKTNVMLAQSCFHESTINALRYYGVTDHHHFLVTADFLEIIRNWWDTVNVKSKEKGRHKRNDYMKPINSENKVEILNNLQKFANWIHRWKSQFPNDGLSKPTFQALYQTVLATIDLCNYLLDEKDEITYILLGLIYNQTTLRGCLVGIGN